jgi:phenylacetate-CoA ligase
MDRYLAFIRYLRYGNIKDRILYLKWYNFIEKSQWWSKDEILKYQWTKLKLLIEEAYNFVPYYSELFHKMGAKPSDINSWEDFEKIPFLTKDIVRERINDLVSIRIKDKSSLRYYTTGGSTGQPLGFYCLPGDAMDRAFMDRQWERVGYTEKSSRVILRGEPIKSHKLFHRQRFTNVWLASSYDLSENSIKQYVDFLNKIKPDFFHVYPSSLYVFTRLFLDAGLTLNFSPKAILCGSESVREFQRNLFEETYNSRVYSWLGLSEGVVLAGECEYSSNYHAWPQLNYNEIINEENKPVKNIGERGEIVGTGLHNSVFPFIRYKTGDVGDYYGDGCELCKRNFLLLRKIDRWLQEIIVSKNNVYVSATGLNPHSDIFDNVIQFQFLQKIPGELILYLVRRSSYSEDDTNRILRELQKKLGNGFKLKIKFVDNIPRTPSGKHRYLVQELKLKLLENY